MISLKHSCQSNCLTWTPSRRSMRAFVNTCLRNGLRIRKINRDTRICRRNCTSSSRSRKRAKSRPWIQPIMISSKARLESLSPKSSIIKHKTSELSFRKHYDWLCLKVGRRKASTSYEYFIIIVSWMVLWEIIKNKSFPAKSLEIDPNAYSNGFKYTFQPPTPIRKGFNGFVYQKWSELT